MENRNWKAFKLGKVTTKIGSGSTPKGGSNAYKDEGISLIRSQNVLDFTFSNDGLAFIDDEQAFRLRGVTVEENDILFNITGDSVARVCKVPSQILPARVNQHVAILRADNINLHYDFLLYLMQSKKEELLIMSEIGATRNAITKVMLENLEIQLPPLSEQKAIASVLSSLDDKIDLLHQQNQTLEALAETLFRQWFIEEAKEDWPIYKFKDIVKHVKPGTNFQPKRVNNGIPFLNVKNLNNGFIDLQNNTFITQEEYERVHKNWKPEVGDLLISRIGTLGLVATILEGDLPIAVHYNMINLKPKLIGTEFLYFFLKSNHFQEEYFSRARQSVQEYLAIEDVEEIAVKLPLEFESFTIKEQQFIEFYNKIKNNFIQIQTLTQLRDTLLPKLMSGEVRVKL